MTRGSMGSKPCTSKVIGGQEVVADLVSKKAGGQLTGVSYH